MPDSPSFDPLAAWRDLVAQWEKSVNSVANQNMTSDQFSGSMNTMLNVMVRAQESMGEVMAKYLGTLNLPSRNDLLTLGEQLGAIEEKLGQIAEILERRKSRARAKPAMAMPPRTKRPPSEPT